MIFDRLKTLSRCCCLIWKGERGAQSRHGFDRYDQIVRLRSTRSIGRVGRASDGRVFGEQLGQDVHQSGAQFHRDRARLSHAPVHRRRHWYSLSLSLSIGFLL